MEEYIKIEERWETDELQKENKQSVILVCHILKTYTREARGFYVA